MRAGFVVVMCVVSSVISSSITLLAVKDKPIENNIDNKNQVVKELDATKSENIYHSVSDKAMPSVVGITAVTINENNIFNIQTQSEGVGSGFIVDSNGYIVTNSHVISDGKAVEVNVVFNDGTSTQGKVLL